MLIIRVSIFPSEMILLKLGSLFGYFLQPGWLVARGSILALSLSLSLSLSLLRASLGASLSPSVSGTINISSVRTLASLSLNLNPSVSCAPSSEPSYISHKPFNLAMPSTKSGEMLRARSRSYCGISFGQSGINLRTVYTS